MKDAKVSSGRFDRMKLNFLEYKYKYKHKYKYKCSRISGYQHCHFDEGCQSFEWEIWQNEIKLFWIQTPFPQLLRFVTIRIPHLWCCAKWASFISHSIADLEFWICQIYDFSKFFSSSPEAGELRFCCHLDLIQNRRFFLRNLAV